MYTRQDYLNKKCTHSEYYGQAVTPALMKFVVNRIWADRILNSTDEHFNDIPLALWDGLHNAIMNNCLGETSLGSTVCIAKEAARQYKLRSATMLETTYVAADTISGVYKIDPADYPELDLMSIKNFVSSLSTLSEDEVIFTVFGPESEDLYNKLNEDYGIH